MGGSAYYLINASDGNQSRSGMAYYSNNDAAQAHSPPDTYIEIESDGFTLWEGNLREGSFTNDYLRTCVVSDGKNFSFGQTAGVARTNGRAWNIYKSDGSVVWAANGWTYKGIYACE